MAAIGILIMFSSFICMIVIPFIPLWMHLSKKHEQIAKKRFEEEQRRKYEAQSALQNALQSCNHGRVSPEDEERITAEIEEIYGPYEEWCSPFAYYRERHV